jgi:excisionase family DNA binding protein
VAEDPYLSIKDITHELKVSHETVRKWLLTGRLPYVRAGRSYRIRRSALDQMLAGGLRPRDPPRTDNGSPAHNPMAPGVELYKGFFRDG